MRLRGGGPGYTVFPEVQAEMAVAAGGLIKQSIHRDTYPPDSWDPSSTIVFNVQILNAEIFESVTGRVSPGSPPDWKTYTKSGGCFFDIPEAASSLSGNFGGVKSVGQKKGKKDDEDGGSWIHLNQDLRKGQPKREFRTTTDIKDNLTESNIVSW